MIEINLVPDVKREYIKTRILRNYVISVASLVSIGVVGLAVVLGVILSGQLIAEGLQDKSIDKEGKRLTAMPDLSKTVTMQQQLSIIDQQHEDKLINSRLFDVMAAINPPAPNDVKITTLKVNPEENNITIEGTATNGYIALEVFKKTIVSTYVQTVQGGKTMKIPLSEEIIAGDTGFGENAEGQRVLRFVFTLTYPQELFASSKTPVAIVTPSGKVDMTDSKLGVPESLFEKPAGGDDGK